MHSATQSSAIARSTTFRRSKQTAEQYACAQIEVTEEVLRLSGFGGEFCFAGDIGRKVIKIGEPCSDDGTDQVGHTRAKADVHWETSCSCRQILPTHYRNMAAIPSRERVSTAMPHFCMAQINFHQFLH